MTSAKKIRVVERTRTQDRKQAVSLYQGSDDGKQLEYGGNRLLMHMNVHVKKLFVFSLNGGSCFMKCLLNPQNGLCMLRISITYFYVM